MWWYEGNYKQSTTRAIMPFISIELVEPLQLSFHTLAEEIQQYIATKLDMPVTLIKVKFVRVAASDVAMPKGLYARLKLELKAGRDPDVLEVVGKELVTRLATRLRAENPQQAIRITADIREIHPDFLFVAE